MGNNWFPQKRQSTAKSSDSPGFICFHRNLYWNQCWNFICPKHTTTEPRPQCYIGFRHYRHQHHHRGSTFGDQLYGKWVHSQSIAIFPGPEDRRQSAYQLDRCAHHRHSDHPRAWADLVGRVVGTRKSFRRCFLHFGSERLFPFVHTLQCHEHSPADPEAVVQETKESVGIAGTGRAQRVLRWRGLRDRRRVLLPDQHGRVHCLLCVHAAHHLNLCGDWIRNQLLRSKICFAPLCKTSPLSSGHHRQVRQHDGHSFTAFVRVGELADKLLCQKWRWKIIEWYSWSQYCHVALLTVAKFTNILPQRLWEHLLLC